MIHNAKNKIVGSKKRQIRRIIFLFKGVDVDELLCFICFPDVCLVRGAKKQTSLNYMYVSYIWTMFDLYLKFIWTIFEIEIYINYISELYVWTLCLNSLVQISARYRNYIWAHLNLSRFISPTYLNFSS